MTVMAYSSTNDSTLMRRSMQAGAREFLIEPFLPDTMSEAFARASARRPNQQKAATGKMLVFVPSKGGVGVTTIAANFALALTKESGAKVGVGGYGFSTGRNRAGTWNDRGFLGGGRADEPTRLDREFLSTSPVRHSSGLSVLASPEEYSFFHFPVDEGADRLFRILREEFDYVVVDAGTCHGHMQESSLEWRTNSIS